MGTAPRDVGGGYSSRKHTGKDKRCRETRRKFNKNNKTTIRRWRHEGGDGKASGGVPGQAGRHILIVPSAQQVAMRLRWGWCASPMPSRSWHYT